MHIAHVRFGSGWLGGEQWLDVHTASKRPPTHPPIHPHPAPLHPRSDIAEEHYKDLSSKPFFPALVEYILSGPVVCMVGWVGGWVVWVGCVGGWVSGWAGGFEQKRASTRRCSPRPPRAPGVGGRGRGQVCAQADRRHQPAGGRAGDDPRRLCGAGACACAGLAGGMDVGWADAAAHGTVPHRGVHVSPPCPTTCMRAHACRWGATWCTAATPPRTANARRVRVGGAGSASATAQRGAGRPRQQRGGLL